MGVIAKRIGGSPRMTDPCELANAIPGAVTTGESAPRQHRVEECDGHQAAVLIQGSSRCPGRLARAGPARQARRLTLQCHPRRVHSASLAVCTIGQGLAAARSLKLKHAVKQVDRLLSNPAINVDEILVRWVP